MSGITFAAGAYIEQLSSADAAFNLDKATVGFLFRRLGRPSGSQIELMGKHSPSSSSEGFNFYLEHNAGANQDTLNIAAKDASGNLAFFFNATPTVVFDGNWHLASANLQTANGSTQDLFLDGSNKASGNASRVWDFNNVPFRFARSNDGYWNDLGGSLAHAFFYNELLTDAEHLALGCGVSPLLIRPHALVLYLPMEYPDFLRNSVPIKLNADATSSGTITRTVFEPPLEPRYDGWLFDDTQLNSAFIPGAATARKFVPVRSARRR